MITIVNQHFNACGTESEDFGGAMCPHCKSINIVEVRQEGCYVCRDCGTQLSQIYDEHESMYVHGECDMNHSRLGPPIDPLLMGSSLSTTIQYNWKFRRLKQMHDRAAMSYTERSLYHAFTYIDKVMRDRLNLGKPVIDTAKCMYKDMKEKRISRGQIHKALTAACVYFACKVQSAHVNVKLTKQEVASSFEVNVAKLNKACKIFRSLMQDKPYFNLIFDTINISDIVVRMVSKLAWQTNIEKWNVIKVITALDNFLESYGCLDNKHLNSVLAAMIYLASTELSAVVDLPNGKKSKVTKNIVCNVYDVTLITLNKTLKDIQGTIEVHMQNMSRNIESAPSMSTDDSDCMSVLSFPSDCDTEEPDPLHL